MASTYSTNLAIELIGTGDQAGAWGNTTNTNLGTLIEQAISGYVTQAVSTGTDTTITIPNGATGVARNMYIELTGTGGTNTNLIVPSNKKLYFIFNNSTGAVTVKVSGQTGVSVPQGKKVVLVSDGTDVVNGLNYIADFGSNSATITQLSATSATITNLTLTSLVISNLSIASANVTTLTSASATITNLINTSASITTITNSPTFSAGTANGVLYLNGSKVATSGSALTFDGTNLLVGTTTAYKMLTVNGNASINNTLFVRQGATDYGLLYANGNAFGFESFQGAPITWAVGAGGTASEQMRLTSTGLGIGTSSPAAKLEVNGNTILGSDAFGAGNAVTIYNSVGGIGSSITLKNSAASVSGRGVSVQFQSSDTTIGSIECATSGASNAGNLRFLTASSGSNTLKMVLDPSGNLGLGVTPSAWRSTEKAMQIGQWMGLFSDSGLTAELSSNMYISSGNQFVYTNTGAATRYRQYLGAHSWFTAASGTAGNTISFTQAMTLDANGNLGLGITAPTSNGGGTSKVFHINAGAASEWAIAHFTNGSTGTAALDGMVIGNIGTDAYVYQYENAPLLFGTNNTERARITSGGDVGIGTSSPGYRLTVQKDSASAGSIDVLHLYNGAGSTASVGMVFSTGANNITSRISNFTTNTNAAELIFETNGGSGLSERARITSGGNFGIGTTSPATRLDVLYGDSASINGSSPNATTALTLTASDPGSVSAGFGTLLQFRGITGRGGVAAIGGVYSGSNKDGDINLVFYRNSGNGTIAEAARITSGGDFCVNKTLPTLSLAGLSLGADNTARFTKSESATLEINRLTSDGDMVIFYQDTVAEGSISVSGNTVSYNAFAGSHWSQLQDGSKPDILRGTVMESINELCVWPGEQNERLPKAKISDTAGSKKVYGVFMAWDNDWATTNDMYITAVGAFICRVNGSVTVQEGDLLESNGDGTARVQADDIIRSSTIGKVTSTVKTHQYDDGSYCVPTVLYCG